MVFRSRRSIIALGAACAIVLAALAVICVVWADGMGRGVDAGMLKPAIVSEYEALEKRARADEKQPSELREEDRGEQCDMSQHPDWPSRIAAFRRLIEHLEGICAPTDLDDLDAQQMETFAAANQDLISEIREVAIEGGPVQGIEITGIRDAKYSRVHIAIGHCIDILCADARNHAIQGDCREVVDNLGAGIRLARAVAMEPSLNAQSTCYWGACSVVKATRECALISGTNYWGKALRDSLRQEFKLAQAETPGRLQLALDGEMWFWHQYFERIRQGAYVQKPALESLTDRLIRGAYDFSLGGLALNRDEQGTLELMRRLRALASKPFHATEHEFAVLEAEAGKPLCSVLTRGVAYSVHVLFESATAHEASLALACLALSAEDFFESNGRYPESVAELSEADLAVDPFTGKPYSYLRLSRGYFVYSVGPNLRDDLGTLDSHSTAWKEALDRGLNYGAPDIAWSFDCQDGVTANRRREAPR